MPASLLISDLGDGVRALTVSNPTRRNAIDAGLLDQLERALGDDAGVRVWLVRGEGEGVFSSGYDLTALNGFPEGTALPDERLGEVLDRLTRHPAPSVAVVTGAAVGAGCELAAACDFRVGSAAARFVMPPAKLGVVYALKGLARLRARVGEQVARRMFLVGRPLDAADARTFGLLDELVDDAPAAALALCRELSANAPLAVRGMKSGLTLLDEVALPESARAAYEALRRQSFNSADAREGRDALLARRAPRFEGR
ncbi:MAG: enoyl-CoA hydratase/isomerase family protein [Myxococcota bacterium]